MNYLAHIYLSGNQKDIQIGNFIGDFIRGNAFEKYSIEIQKGIMLHRFIDTFTDAHPIFRKSKKRLFNEFRHYSAVIVDMFYDHFLAKNFDRYSSVPLYPFSQKFYKTLEEYRYTLPQNIVNLIPVITEFNWLYSYRDLDGLSNILNQMNNRTAHETKLQESVVILEANYTQFENEFFEFFKTIQIEVEKEKVKMRIS